MMNKAIKLIACKLLLLPILALAADDWYQIEVIAFQYIQPETEPELWASHPGEPELSRGIFLFDSKSAARAHFGHVEEEEEAVVEQVTPAEPENDLGFVTVGEIVGADAEPELEVANKKSITEPPFVALPSRNYTMRDVEKIISENKNYRLLSHVAWRQPALSGREVEQVRIVGGDQLGKGPDNVPLYELDGLLTFKKSRFLHIEADVVLREPGSSASGSFESAEELGLVSDSRGRTHRAPNLTNYRMKQSQRVRSDKLYYYDHPLMGMIVKITPYEPT